MQWLLRGFPGTTGATWIKITIMSSLVCLAALAHHKKYLIPFFLHFFTHYRSICIEWEKLCSQSEYKLCLALYGFNCLGFFCAKLCRHSKSKYIHWHGYVLMYFLDGAHCHFWGFLPRCHWIAINWRFRGQLNSKVIKRLDSIIVVQQFCNNEVEWTVKVYFDKRKNICIYFSST